MTKAQFSGIIPPLVTPLDDRGAYVGDAMERLIDRVVDAGVHGVLVLGSMGEFSEIDTATRKIILTHTVAHVKGRVPVFLGIGAPSTRETIDLGHHAQSVGVDAALVVNDFYSPLSRAKPAGFYRDVAASIDLPLFLYNFPAMTGQDLEPSLVRELALSCENIVGIKDTIDAVAHTRQIILEIHTERPEFMVFAGNDDQMLSALTLGGAGGIPATANFAPEIACGLYRAFRENDYPATIALQRQISTLVSIYGVDIPPYGAVKAAIRMTGLISRRRSSRRVDRWMTEESQGFAPSWILSESSTSGTHSGFFLGLSLQREPHLAPRQPTIRTRREQRQSLDASVTAQHARSATDSSRPRVGRRADLFHEGGRRDYVACRVRNAATRTTRQRVVRPKGGKTFFLTPHLRIQMPVHNRLTAGNLWPIAATLPRARASTVRRTRYWAREQQSLCERLYGHSTPAKGQA